MRPRSLVALGAAVALLVAACGSTPLTDPQQIVSKAKSAMEGVKTFHFQADATGQMVIGVDETPSGSPGASADASPTPLPPIPTPEPSGATKTIQLQGTTATGDVDLGAGKANVTGNLPGIPGMIGQVVVIGDQAYVRTAGEMQFHQVAASSLPFNPADPQGVPGVIDAVLTLASDPNVKPTLAGTEDCVEGRCYHVKVTITADEANRQIGSGGFAVGAGELELWVLTDSFRVAQATFTSTDPVAGTFVGRIAFSDYGRGVSIDTPTPDQIVPD